MGAGSGMPVKQILFVVEGNRTEPDVILAALHALGVDTERFGILTFGTNVHTLIGIIGDGAPAGQIDFEGIEIKELLANMLESGEGTLGGLDRRNVPRDDLRDADWLRTAKITDFFLMFVFDPHAPAYDPECLRAFQNAFVDSASDLGRLLISYPMVESFKEACALEAEEFMDLEAEEPLSSYKDVVHARLRDRRRADFDDLRKYRGEDFARGLALSTAKTRALLAGDHLNNSLESMRFDLAAACDEVDLPALLASQQETYGRNGTVPVVCTGLFFMSLWPRALNNAWGRCKSTNMV